MTISRRSRVRLAVGAAAFGVAVVAAVVWQVVAGGGGDPSAASPVLPPPAAEGVNGFVFQDRDGDGRWGPGDVALADWAVSIYSTGTLPIVQATTDSHGVFDLPAIDNVTPGETTVMLRLQPVLEGPAAATMPDPTALSQSFTLALGSQTAIPVTSLRECLAAADCPDLRLPDLSPIITDGGADEYPPSTDTLVDTTTEPGRVLLRFATSAVNLGGLLHVTALPTAPGATEQTIQQRVYGDATVLVRDAGRFTYHPEHHHFHVADFERYELLSADQSQVLGTGSKVSFCLTDVIAVDPPERSDGDVFLDLPPFECGATEQGINMGYADYYGRDLPDQWIDVTDVASGDYWIRITVDPDQLLLESDTTNNTLVFPVTYQAPAQ